MGARDRRGFTARCKYCLQPPLQAEPPQMTSVRFTRDSLSNSDLLLDAIYEGGRAGNAGDDPLGPLLGVSNQGGFRHLGKKERPELLAITTSMNEPDWPDHLDLETGLFTYFGDNRRPGR